MVPCDRTVTEFRISERERDLINAKLHADVVELDNILLGDYKYFEFNNVKLIKEDELLIAKSKVVRFDDIKIIDYRLLHYHGDMYRTSLVLEYYGEFAGKQFAKLRNLNHIWIDVSGVLKLKLAYSTSISKDIDFP